MISLFVVYCMVLNPTMCRVLELAPVDHEIVSIPECIRGGAMGDIAGFTLDHAQWRVKGWKCKEVPTMMQTWLQNHPEVQ